MSTTSHSLSTTSAPFIAARSTIVSSTFVALRNELASTRIQCTPTTAWASLSLALRYVGGLDVLLSTSATSPSTKGSRNASAT